jgi:hypothetical protein
MRAIIAIAFVGRWLLTFHLKTFKEKLVTIQQHKSHKIRQNFTLKSINNFTNIFLMMYDPSPACSQLNYFIPSISEPQITIY